MKTEIDHTFELKDDSESSKFHKRAIWATFVVSYLVGLTGAYCIVRILDWIMR